jgi:Protein of unknown function (DUF3667)
MNSCTNCNHTLQAQARYCDYCGQSIESFQRPIKPVLTDMIHETLDIDGRIFLTLKTLLTKPGVLSSEYRDGRRAKYTPPLRMYLVISISFFLLVSLLDSTRLDPDGVRASEVEYYSRLMFLLLPVFALFLQLLYRSTFYIGNLIFAMHVHSVSYLVFMIMFPLEAYEETSTVLIYLQIPLLLYLSVYFPLALKQYYAESWMRTLLKLVALIFLYAGVMGVSFDFLLPQFLSFL